MFFLGFNAKHIVRKRTRKGNWLKSLKSSNEITDPFPQTQERDVQAPARDVVQHHLDLKDHIVTIIIIVTMLMSVSPASWSQSQKTSSCHPWSASHWTCSGTRLGPEKNHQINNLSKFEGGSFNEHLERMLMIRVRSKISWVLKFLIHTKKISASSRQEDILWHCKK